METQGGHGFSRQSTDAFEKLSLLTRGFHTLVMVYYFKSTEVDPPQQIYVGKDKTESAAASLVALQCWTSHADTTCTPDEDLIKYGWNEDIW